MRQRPPGVFHPRNSPCSAISRTKRAVNPNALATSRVEHSVGNEITGSFFMREFYHFNYKYLLYLKKLIFKLMSKRILIVEDHADIRKLIRMTLEFEYYDIHEAANAQEGLDAIRRLHPQLVLLDIMMPGEMDGLDLCQMVKNDPSLGLPQVVLLTARGQDKDIEAGMNAGADAYLLKPFSPLQLITTIDSLGIQTTETQ